MRSVVMALLLVAMMVGAAVPIAMPSEDAGSSVSVASSTPEITAISVDPAEITLVPGISVESTLTVEVFCPNSVDWIKSVEITAVDPPPKCENMRKIFPLPITMKRVRVEGLIRADYEATLEMLCIPATDYTLTVTATDKDDNTAIGTVTFTVGETLALSVSDVDFGTLAPGKSSEAYSAVTNTGNVPFVFEESNGIVLSAMHSSGSGTIEASDIAVNWDWSKVIRRTAPGDVGFTLSVPFGTLPGKYTGTIAFTPTPAN